MTDTPPGEAFIVFAIIAIAALHIARINRLPSLLCTDDRHNLLFCAPENTLFNRNQATLLFVFDHLRMRLLDSLVWRQRLPIVGEAGAADASSQLRESLSMLGDDLRREFQRPALADELIRKFTS